MTISPLTKLLAIGSQALHTFLPSKGRRPVDLDLICSCETMKQFCAENHLHPVKLADYKWQVSGAPIFGHIEFELLEYSLSGQQYMKQITNPTRVMAVYDTFIPVATPEILYSIKRSHRHYPRQWSKHIQDYFRLRDYLGGIDALADVTSIREKETEERYGKLKTPVLDKSAEDFFDDSVSNKIFVHDDIHSVMAHREQPMYEYIKISQDKVACSKKKFFELTYPEQVQCVLEEAYVISLERAIIPMLYQGKKYADGQSAMQWSLMRICTTLTSGWFREFATENYREIMAAYDTKFVQKFLSAIDQGKIRRIYENL